MEKITTTDGESFTVGTNSEGRRLSELLGTTTVAINQYRLAPGDGLPGGLHAHMDQEEVFAVLDGEAIFETLAGTVTVGEGELIRFEPGEFQSGKNNADSELTLFAIGIPRDTEDIRIPVACPMCDHDTLRLDKRDDEFTFVCPDCGTEHIPQDCPACGHTDMRVTLAEAPRTVVVCQNCETAFETPPLRN